jgi:hypothetical protein
MTLASRPHTSAPRPRREFDIRCSAALIGRAADEGRCQLWAGHVGPHAVMSSDAGIRTVRTWATGSHLVAIEAGAAALQRPWMRGFPVPAWFEPTPAPDR